VTEEKRTATLSAKKAAAITLPLSYLVLLFCSAATIALALGFICRPWIQAKLQQRGQMRLQTVLASTPAPQWDSPISVPAPPSVQTATIDQLRQMAEKGNPIAENALGLRYFQGDEKNGIAQNEVEAFHWFSSAAEHGSLAAQSKLGFLYWSGRG